MSDVEIKDYFISFTNTDLEMARALNDALIDAGFSTWFHEENVHGGMNSIAWMNRGLDQSTQVLALCSSAYFDPSKGFSEGERNAAIYDALDNREERLIPVLLKDCKLPALMRPLSHIDLRGQTIEAAKVKLLEKLKSAEQAANKSKAETLTRSRKRPRVFNIQGTPNRFFMGRDVSLNRLHELMMSPSSDVTAITAQGMGGIGKTTLAREYAFKRGVDAYYAGVWWVEAESETSILAAYERLAKELVKIGVTDIKSTDNQRETAEDVKGWLSRQDDSKPWLLIFDNVPDAETIDGWVPASPVRSIITTRNTEIGDIATPLSLDTWTLEETVEFLRNRIGRGTDAELTSLAKRLDGLPLAAEQAGAFLRSRQTVSFAGYEQSLIKYLKRTPKILKGGYPKSLYATFETALEDLRRRELGEAALGVFNICAYLSPDGVELMFLTKVAQQSNILPNFLQTVLSDEVDRSDAIAALTDYSLLRQEHDEEWGLTLHLHRLLGDIVRTRIDEAKEEEWLGVAIEVIKQFMPYESDISPSTWPLCARLVRHVAVIRLRDVNLHLFGESFGYCLNQAALYLGARGDYEFSIGLFRQRVRIGEVVYRDNPVLIAIGLTNLANRLRDDEKHWNEVEQIYERALSLKETHLPDKDPSLASTLDNFGGFRAKQKRYPEAIKLSERAADIDKVNSGEVSWQYAMCLRNLGTIYGEWAEDTNDHTKRQKEMYYKQRAASITLLVKGWRHPYTALDFNNLAVMYFRSNDILRVVEDMSHAVAINLSIGQNDHPQTQMQIATLLHLWEQLGETDKLVRFRSGNFVDILSYVEKIENKHREWVAEDPDNRHFGPPSPITGARE